MAKVGYNHSEHQTDDCSPRWLIVFLIWSEKSEMLMQKLQAMARASERAMRCPSVVKKTKNKTQQQQQQQQKSPTASPIRRRCSRSNNDTGGRRSGGETRSGAVMRMEMTDVYDMSKKKNKKKKTSGQEGMMPWCMGACACVPSSRRTMDGCEHMRMRHKQHSEKLNQKTLPYCFNPIFAVPLQVCVRGPSSSSSSSSSPLCSPRRSPPPQISVALSPVVWPTIPLSGS